MSGGRHEIPMSSCLLSYLSTTQSARQRLLVRWNLLFHSVQELKFWPMAASSLVLQVENSWLGYVFKAGGLYKIFVSKIENLLFDNWGGKIETFAWVSHLMKSNLFIYWNVTYHGNCPPSSFVGLLTWGESSPRNKRKSQLVQPYFSRWLEHPSKSGWSRQRTQLCPRAETLSWPVGSRTR